MAHWLATSREWQVCGTCSELRGPFIWRLKGQDDAHVQACSCVRDKRPDGERPETWRGFSSTPSPSCATRAGAGSSTAAPASRSGSAARARSG